MGTERSTAPFPPSTAATPFARWSWLRPFTSLGNRDYLLYWASLIGSFNAMQMQMVARGWLVYEITDSAFALGLVTAVWGIPVVALSLFGGVLADRAPKRDVLIATQGWTLLGTLPIAVLILLGRVELWHLVVYSLFVGTAWAFNMPARHAYVRDLVEPGQLLNAVALNASAMNLTRIASPAVAGLLVAPVGVGGVYSLVALSYLGVMACLAVIPISGRTAGATAKARLWDEVRDGLSYVRATPIVMALLGLAFIPVVVAMPYQMLLPIFAVDVLHVGADGLGLLLTAVGLGALIGSLVVGALDEFKRKGVLLLSTCMLFGAGLVAFAMADVFHLSFAFLLLVGIGSAGYMAVNNMLIMAIVPPEKIGRVMSLYMMTYGLNPLGTLPAGAVAGVIGAPLTVLAGGVLMLVLSLALFLWRRDLLALE